MDISACAGQSFSGFPRSLIFATDMLLPLFSFPSGLLGDGGFHVGVVTSGHGGRLRNRGLCDIVRLLCSLSSVCPFLSFLHPAVCLLGRSLRSSSSAWWIWESVSLERLSQIIINGSMN